MLNEDSVIIIFITCGDKEDAQNISSVLVSNHLIACGNILSDVTSIFRWENRIENEDEVLLIAKSRHSRFDEIMKIVKEIHSYETPEIIALPVVAGSEDYLTWVMEETSNAE